MEVAIIVAYNRNRVIGSGGKIPWYIPEDLRLFRETTMGHPVVMGRKTWESIPPKFRPLSGRLSLVVSRSYAADPNLFLDTVPDHNVKGDEANTYDSVEKALSYAGLVKPGSTVYVAGGGEIYRECLDKGLVSRVLASEVDDGSEGDTTFPELGSWWGVFRSQRRDGFSSVEYRRCL